MMNVVFIILFLFSCKNANSALVVTVDEVEGVARPHPNQGTMKSNTTIKKGQDTVNVHVEVNSNITKKIVTATSPITSVQDNSTKIWEPTDTTKFTYLVFYSGHGFNGLSLYNFDFYGDAQSLFFVKQSDSNGWNPVPSSQFFSSVFNLKQKVKDLPQSELEVLEDDSDIDPNLKFTTYAESYETRLPYGALSAKVFIPDLFFNLESLDADTKPFMELKEGEKVVAVHVHYYSGLAVLALVLSLDSGNKLSLSHYALRKDDYLKTTKEEYRATIEKVKAVQVNKARLDNRDLDETLELDKKYRDILMAGWVNYHWTLSLILLVLAAII